MPSGLSRESDSQTTAVLNLLADPDRLKERLDQYQKAKAEAQKTIALAGKASEIVKMREEIEDELEKQKAATEQAHVEATSILAEAKETAQQTLDKAKQKAADLVAAKTLELEEAAREKGEAQNLKRELKAQKDLVETAEAKAEQAEKEYLERKTQADKLIEELKAEKRKLEELRGSIASALEA